MRQAPREDGSGLTAAVVAWSPRWGVFLWQPRIDARLPTASYALTAAASWLNIGTKVLESQEMAFQEDGFTSSST